jgi:hypothetical protein
MRSRYRLSGTRGSVTLDGLMLYGFHRPVLRPQITFLKAVLHAGRPGYPQRGSLAGPAVIRTEWGLAGAATERKSVGAGTLRPAAL